jgi:nucleoside phosphorylase
MTHRQHVEDQYAFEAFVMLNLTRRLWQETQIQSIQSSSAPEERSGVKFVMPQDQKRQQIRPRFQVKRLCEHIEKSQSRPSMRLNLAVENGRLWKDPSSKSELPISRSDLPLSLEDIIKSHPTSLTEKTKRVLAVLLAYSVLHLRQTPWLQPSCFNAANILFFSTATTIPLKPYIHTELNKVDHNAAEDIGQIGDIDTEIDPDDLPVHPYPDIIMLAIMLMELYMIQPIQSLAEKAEMGLDDWDNIDDNTRYATAVEVFDRFKAEFPDNYRKAVDKCLDQNIGLDQDNEELDEEGLKCLIYEEIVQPLEDELDQGFGNTIPIDSLDEVAQTLDLRSWGQVRLNQQPSSPPESVENIQPFHDRPKGLGGTFISLPDTRLFSQSNESSKDRGYSPLLSGENIHRSLSDPYSLSALSHQNYTVGWICALPKEMAAARAMLDEIHRPLPQDVSDRNNYILGRMGVHNVVMACLPTGVVGTVSAARVANHMLSTFKWLRFGLMVGIGGGVPGVKDVRLGDVVVGAPSGPFGGVIQYDFGKTMQDCKFFRTGTLNRPPDILLTAISRLQADHYWNRPKLENYLKEIVTQYPRLSPEFSHPGVEHDLLYHCEYDHPLDKESCEQCDLARLIQRIPRESHLPYIHYGLIASGNQVMRNGVARDRLRKDLDVLCFEMEAAGLVDDFPCLVIRGICDYSDSHKNKKWQGYAAATAAAYAKELLSVISGNQIEDAKRLVHY